MRRFFLSLIAIITFSASSAQITTTSWSYEQNDNGDGTIDALVRRVEAISGVTYNLEFISGLASSGANGAGWTDVTTITPTVTSNGDGTETALYHDLATVPGLSSTQGFVRVRVDETSTGATARTDAHGAPRLNCVFQP